MDHKILIVQIGALTDVIHSMPMLDAIREADPTTQVHWLAGESCSEVLRGHAWLQKLVVLDDSGFLSTGVMNLQGAFQEVLPQLRRGYDLIIIGHRDPGYAFVLRPFLWGPIYQISSADEASQSRNVVFVPPESMHNSLAIRKLLGVALKSLNIKLKYTWREAYTHIGSPFATLPENYVVVDYHANFEKKWPGTFEIIEMILSETQHAVVVIGTKDDRNIFEKNLNEQNGLQLSRVLNLVGTASVREHVGIIRMAQLFIGCDSGLLHVADSLGVRTIGLYDSMVPVERGLVGVQSRPVGSPTIEVLRRESMSLLSKEDQRASTDGESPF